MKNITIFAILLSLMLLSGCWNADSDDTVAQTEPIPQQKFAPDTTEQPRIIAYSDFQQLFDSLVKTLRIPGYTYKSGSVGLNIVIFEKDLSFNKREYLTLDGKFDSSDAKPTSELLLFESSDGTNQLTIRLSYTSSYIGNDLVDWSSARGYAGTNETLAQKTELSTLTYKNLILTILQTSEEEADMEASKAAIRSLIPIITKY